MTNYKKKTRILVKAASHVLRNRNLKKKAAQYVLQQRGLQKEAGPFSFQNFLKQTGKITKPVHTARRMNAINSGMNASDQAHQALSYGIAGQTAAETGTGVTEAVAPGLLPKPVMNAVRTSGKTVGVVGGVAGTADAAYDTYNTLDNWNNGNIDDYTAAVQGSQNVARTAGNAVGTVGVATGNPALMAGFLVDPLVSGMEEGYKWGENTISAIHPYTQYLPLNGIVADTVAGTVANGVGSTYHGGKNLITGAYSLGTHTIPRFVRKDILGETNLDKTRSTLHPEQKTYDLFVNHNTPLEDKVRLFSEFNELEPSARRYINAWTPEGQTAFSEAYNQFNKQKNEGVYPDSTNHTAIIQYQQMYPQMRTASAPELVGMLLKLDPSMRETALYDIAQFKGVPVHQLWNDINQYADLSQYDPKYKRVEAEDPKKMMQDLHYWAQMRKEPRAVPGYSDPTTKERNNATNLELNTLATNVFSSGSPWQQWKSIETFPEPIQGNLKEQFKTRYGENVANQFNQTPELFNSLIFKEQPAPETPVLPGKTVKTTLDFAHRNNPFYNSYLRTGGVPSGDVTPEPLPTAPTVNIPQPQFNPADLRFRVNPRNY